MGPSPMALPVPLFPPVGAGRELVPVKKKVYDNNFANRGDADARMQCRKTKKTQRNNNAGRTDNSTRMREVEAQATRKTTTAASYMKP